MKGSVVLGTMAVLVLFAGSAAAADVSGKWLANVLTRMGGSQLQMPRGGIRGFIPVPPMEFTAKRLQ